MNLETAQKLASLDIHQLEQGLKDSGYLDCKIAKITGTPEIVSKTTVKYTVIFVDDGSFEDRDALVWPDCSGSLFAFVNEKGEVLVDF